MKKFLIILCSVFLLTGCSEKNIESSISETVPESTTASHTEEVTTEVTTETTTEETTELNVYEKQTYHEILENIYYDCKFPDWDYKNYNKDVSIDFAVYDIDSDDRDELLVTFDNRAVYVYDHNTDGNLVKQFSGYIRSDFYENGAVRVYSAHNQTHSFEVHPFEMYKYNNETDSYDKCGGVYGIDKDIVDMINKEKEEVGRTDFLEYPSKYDTSDSGTVYYIRSDDETEIPLDLTEYNEYCEQFTENTDIIDIPFMKLTEENIKNVNV
ncbi:MAG: membrane lipoprotein lipid attachment site-containing protein [Ruminococcus sp.]|nr:membrane lipoprotein lipid attachment site-containing protein [Ruminococcus sp.]